MLSDPQTLTVNAIAIPCPRTSFGVNSGTLTSADGLNKLTLSHTYGKRNRHLIRWDSSQIAADPLTAGINVKASMSTYLVIDMPTTGYTNTQAKYNVDALVAYLQANTGLIVSKLIAGES